ncbi:hypothetical protein [Vibrio phage vB_ValP_IME271]|nr:hypothetical protein [Vibrio phage vB_ValP_IME271]
MSFFSNIFDFDNFDLGEIAMMPITQMEADFNFVKDVFSGDADEAFGNHQDAMTEMQGSLGLNKDNKIVKNSDAIVGSIFGAVLGGGALAAGAGGGAAGGGGAAAGGGFGSGAAVGSGGLGSGAFASMGSMSAPAGGATATSGGLGAGAASTTSLTPAASSGASTGFLSGGGDYLNNINQGMNLLQNLQGQPPQMQLQSPLRGARSYQTNEAPTPEKTYGGLI